MQGAGEGNAIHLKTYTGLGNQISFAGMARSWQIKIGFRRDFAASLGPG
jgi:hypothetical protein